VSRIIALDPGEQTGWATGYTEEQEDGTHLIVADYGYGPWKSVLMRFMSDQIGYVNGPLYGQVVYESWRLRADVMKKLVGSDLQSSQFIGGMKATVWWVQTKMLKPCSLHTNEPGNKPAIDGWMDKAGKGDYLPHTDKEHPRDAVRHLCFHAVKRLNVREEHIHVC
jgi:hypothetical protein